jgi:replicative DNA helicase
MSAVLPERNNPPPRVDVLRVPPHSIEAEQSVLGGLMLVGEAWDQVADRLVEEDFYRREHRLIFRAIGQLAGAGQPCDAVTLGEWFERHGETANVGGVAYLAELANNTPSAANIAAYADIVRDKSVLRKLIEAGTQIAGDGFNPEGRGTPEILETAEQRVFKIAEAGARGRKQVVPVRQSVKEAVELLAQRYANRGQLNGLTTGFKDLDDLTSGMQRQDLVIVAGRPSMGKTAFALNIAEAVAMRAKQPVLVFSMEMSASQLAFRLISSMGRINQKDLRSGELAEEEWPRVSQAASLLSESKIFIDDTPALSPGELRSRARRMMREHGLGLVVIDYLQLMQVPGNKENRATETGHAGDCAVAVEPRAGTAQRQAPGDERPARIGRDRAGRRPDPVHLSRRGLQQGIQPQGRRRNHHRQATQRPHRHHQADLPRPVHQVRELRAGSLRRHSGVSA